MNRLRNFEREDMKVIIPTARPLYPSPVILSPLNASAALQDAFPLPLFTPVRFLVVPLWARDSRLQPAEVFPFELIVYGGIFAARMGSRYQRR